MDLGRCESTILMGFLSDKLPVARAFNIPPSYDTADMLRADLEAAGIPFRDSSGRVVDLHALRHTFVTTLAKSGVHPSTAQALARHSDINLTMSRYTHSVLESQAEALERMPSLPAPGETTRKTAAVGSGAPDGLPEDADLSRRSAGRFSPDNSLTGLDNNGLKSSEREEISASESSRRTASKRRKTAQSADGKNKKKWSHPRDSNPEPALYESAALPLS